MAAIRPIEARAIVAERDGQVIGIANYRENNYRARGLYDKYTPHSGFLRYVVLNPAII